MVLGLGPYFESRCSKILASCTLTVSRLRKGGNEGNVNIKMGKKN